MAKTTIELSTDWHWEDADGGECAACEQARFGKQLRQRLFIEKKEAPQESPPILCASCGELVQPQF